MKCEAAIDLFVEKDAAFNLIKESFSIIKEAVNVLGHVQVVTKLLQKTDFTLSDFYGAFIRLRQTINQTAGLQNKQTNLANCLLKELDARRDGLLKNESMLCAVYLDRRFAVLLSVDQIEFAKKSLYKLYKKSITVMKLDEPEKTNDNNNKSKSDVFDFEAFLIGTGCEPLICDETESGNEELIPAVANFNSKLDEKEFLILLDRFETQFQRIHYKIPILNFWKENEKTFPELYVLSTMLNSIPPAQASVERCFSVLSFLYNCRRCKLSVELLQELLLININKDMVEEIFVADLKELRNSLKI